MDKPTRKHNSFIACLAHKKKCKQKVETPWLGSQQHCSREKREMRRYVYKKHTTLTIHTYEYNKYTNIIRTDRTDALLFDQFWEKENQPARRGIHTAATTLLPQNRARR